MLDQLHKDHLDELWGIEDGSDQSQSKRGSVVAVDFYNAGK